MSLPLPAEESQPAAPQEGSKADSVAVPGLFPMLHGCISSRTLLKRCVTDSRSHKFVVVLPEQSSFFAEWALWRLVKLQSGKPPRGPGVRPPFERQSQPC
jgi:hypothetical protein